MDPYMPAERARKSRWLRASLLVAPGVIVGVVATLAAVQLTSRPVKAAPAKPAAASASPTPQTVTMSGHISMPRYDKTEDPEFRTANWQLSGSGDCEGEGGYGDMVEGADVTVYDAAGEVVGAGSLEAGKRLGGECVWGFSVPGLPESSFYQVEVSHRGKVTVQRAVVGFVEMSLGD